MRLRVFLSILLLFTTTAVSAQVTETFSIRLAAGSDVTPPTTPTILVLDAVASSQVDVSWSTATDDFFLAGYVLYRDGLPLATTSLTTFSDTGLTASTSYTYSVQAFDSSFNYSSTSATSSVITPNPPPPPVAATSSPGATRVSGAVRNFSLVPTETTAEIEFDTNIPMRIEVRWGRTADYEIGYTVLERYVRFFDHTISDLEPGTNYEYEIIGYTPGGIETVLKRGQFSTQSQTASVPANVRGLFAEVREKNVYLTWSQPEGEFASIRIVRSHLGYPTSPNDGAIVYQSDGTSFFDEGILDLFSPVYYTVFVFDSNGNVSSGAVISVALQANGSGIIFPVGSTDRIPVGSGDGVEVYDDRATTSRTPVADSVRIPSQREIFIISGADQFSFIDAQVNLDSTRPFLIRVPVTAVSKNLKTLVVSFVDPNDKRKQYSYILRINKDASAYEAAVAAPLVSGKSQFEFVLYDYEAKVVAKYRKLVTFENGNRANPTIWFPDYLYAHWWQAIGIFFGGLLLLWFLSWLLFRREDSSS